MYMDLPQPLKNDRAICVKKFGSPCQKCLWNIIGKKLQIFDLFSYPGGIGFSIFLLENCKTRPTEWPSAWHSCPEYFWYFSFQWRKPECSRANIFSVIHFSMFFYFQIFFCYFGVFEHPWSLPCPPPHRGALLSLPNGLHRWYQGKMPLWLFSGWRKLPSLVYGVFLIPSNIS